jgi:opacity protein-like surface antigen
VKPVSTRSYIPRLLDRALVGAGLFLALLLIGVQVAKAAEIIPSVGFSRAVDSDNDQVDISGGLAFRAPFASIFKTEIGVQYRAESHFDDQLKVRQWPITASLWFAPVPALYAGGGVGWYHTTLDYENDTLFEDETTSQFGVHLGGGLRVPLVPTVALDLNGRYVFLDDVQQKISTEKLDPDFWSASLGLAIGF